MKPLLLAMLFCILSAVNLAAIDFTLVQTAALAAAAVLAVPITHFLKKAANLSGGAALILAGVIAAVLTVIAMFSTGQAHGWQDVVVNAAGVFGVAQVIFRTIVYADRAAKGDSQ